MHIALQLYFCLKLTRLLSYFILEDLIIITQKSIEHKVKTTFEFLEQIPFYTDNLDITNFFRYDLQLNVLAFILAKFEVLSCGCVADTLSHESKIRDLDISQQLVGHFEPDGDGLAHVYFPDLFTSELLTFSHALSIVDRTLRHLINRDLRKLICDLI